jgi:AraC-like DNA-binding protein
MNVILPTLIITQSIVAMLFFLWTKPNHISSKILAMWFFINALKFLRIVLPDGLILNLDIGYVPFLYLVAPIFLFYVRSLIEKDFKLKKRDAFHLILFFFIAISRFFYFSDTLNSNRYFEERISMEYGFIYWGASIQLLCYIVLIFNLLLKHRKNLKNQFATKSEKHTLNWVVAMMVFVFFSQLILLSPAFFQDFFLSTKVLFLWFNEFNFGLLAFLILILGKWQPIIYPTSLIKSKKLLVEREFIKSRQTKLGDDLQNQYAKQIIEFLEKGKAYLNPDYNLDLLSQGTGIPRQAISKVIKEKLGKSFYLCINEFRVKEFKLLMQNPTYNHISFLDLAFDSGFNSKSSFYRIFKEITGQTPTEFKSSLNE